MRLSIKVDISIALKTFSTVTKKVSYATNNALTRVAKEMVDAGQKELAADFTLRKRFVLTRLKILQYSKVGNLTTIVGIDAKVAGSPLLIGFFEEGGEKRPSRGGSIAVPLTGTAARPNFTSPIRGALKYANLQIQNGKGKARTYVVPDVGVFERVGRGKESKTVLIYAFEQSAPLHKQMNLTEVMESVANSRFRQIFAEEFEKEVQAYLHR